MASQFDINQATEYNRIREERQHLYYKMQIIEAALRKSGWEWDSSNSCFTRTVTSVEVLK